MGGKFPIRRSALPLGPGEKGKEGQASELTCSECQLRARHCAESSDVSSSHSLLTRWAKVGYIIIPTSQMGKLRPRGKCILYKVTH